MRRFKLFSKQKAGPPDNPSSSSSSSSRKSFPKGIKLLHCPVDSAIDIVFVHGLTGDRERTWTAKDASNPWPQTLLPSKLPTARILTFGYDAYVADWRGVVSQNRIENHAYNLLTSLASYREEDDTNEHPIIFVCHSLGGLVCEDALVKAQQQPERHLQNILRATRGIAFLGTPHHGAGLARWAEKLSRYTGIVKQTNSKIVEVLKQDSEVLARIQHDFHTMIRARNQEGLQPIEISCFYEELPLVGVGFVVPQDSAILPGYIPIGIHSNHMDMGKFTGIDDAGFTSICGELRQWIREISAHENSVGESQNGRAEHDSKKRCTSQFIVPYTDNPQFIGRSEILEQLKRQLGHQKPRHNNHSHFRIALYGLGGIGKTQIALTYVFWLRKVFPNISVFWVHASNVERFRQAYASIAKECQVPGHDGPKADVLSLLKRWLEEEDRGQWLMVIDNADDAQLFCRPAEVTEADAASITNGEVNLGRYIPECAHGAVLITTRNKQVGSRLTRGIPPIGIGKMDNSECCQLLRTRLDHSLVATGELSTLASRLEQLPLALAQAAAFMQENTIGVDSYLRMLDQSDHNLISLLSEEFETIGRDSGMPHAVAATWMLSFEQIERQNSFASQLLSLMSLFDRQAIPIEFLSSPEELQKSRSQREDIQLMKALGLLKAYSLVTEENGHSLAMHRLVQLVTQKWLTAKGEMPQFARKALLTVSHYYPYGKWENHDKCSGYLPHAQAVLKLSSTKSRDETLARADLLLKVGAFLSIKGQWNHAERLEKQAMEIRKELLGPDHPDTLAIMNNLASTYWNQGRWKEAELLGVQVLEIRKEVLGPDHPSTLMSMTNLALTYSDQGRWKEAEALQVHALEMVKTLLGPDHPSTLMSMNNLASTYSDQGRWKEAEALQVHALEMEKTLLGPDHPGTLISMTNLALTYSGQGRWKEAEALQVHALEMEKTLLGPDHPGTLISMTNLALTYSGQGRWKEAEALQVHALKMEKTLLGPDHPSTLTSMANLAFTWEGLGRVDDAAELMEQCAQARIQTLGPEHPDTQSSLSTLQGWRMETPQTQDVESGK
ncbi:hypothetical protein HD806DRAFT_541795 [Xylariaceae sp. AK1471]|nr:hypothetical protein HD806DRAFT_541795 [Xylariaceae sp. AK1471]